EKLRWFYGQCLAWALAHRAAVVGAFGLFVAFSCSLYPLIGHDFFPSVDSGQIRMHVRAPAGTRIEESERYFTAVEDAIREIVPPHEIQTMINNIGIPNSGINLALSDGTLISSADGEILITLHEDHAPTANSVTQLPRQLPERFPPLAFYFKPPDIVAQVLNFGLAAPIDIQLVGPRGNQPKNLEIARQIRDRITEIPGVVDTHLH